MLYINFSSTKLGSSNKVDNNWNFVERYLIFDTLYQCRS